MRPTMRPIVLLVAPAVLLFSRERDAVAQQPSVAPVHVPAEGTGPQDAQALLLPDGTKVLKAPGAVFDWTKQTQKNPIAGEVYDVNFSGEAVLIVPPSSSHWRVVGPNGLGVGHFFMPGRYSIRATPEGFLVTVDSGAASLEPENHGIIQVIHMGQSGIALPDNKRVQRVFFKQE